MSINREWLRGLVTGIAACLLGISLGTLFSGCGSEVITLQGVPGSPGTQGPQGSDGKDSNPVTAVKLCPGESSFPSMFIEYAFCVDHRLYATYSANGGFTTYLPPGTYNSNAVGSACTFTVESDCKVTN